MRNLNIWENPMSITSYWRPQHSTKKHSNLASGISRATSLVDVKRFTFRSHDSFAVAFAGLDRGPNHVSNFELFRGVKGSRQKQLLHIYL